MPEERRLHNKQQVKYFQHKVDFFCQPIPEEIQRRTLEIAIQSGISRESSILDVGTGTGALIKHFLECGVEEKNIVGCDLTEEMLRESRERFPEANFWLGDIIDFPWPMPAGFADHIETFDAVFFNACFGNIFDQALALKRAHRMLSPRGKIVLSHPLGARFVKALHEAEPDIVPHLLPDQKKLVEFTGDLPLTVQIFRDESDFYLAVLSSEGSA